MDQVILRNRAEQDAERAAMMREQDRDLKDWADWLAKVPTTA